MQLHSNSAEAAADMIATGDANSSTGARGVQVHLSKSSPNNSCNAGAAGDNATGAGGGGGSAGGGGGGGTGEQPLDLSAKPSGTGVGAGNMFVDPKLAYR